VEPYVSLFAEEGSEEFIPKQDNERPHVARDILEYLHAAYVFKSWTGRQTAPTT